MIGVAERNGRAVLPPAGIAPSDVDRAQRWIRGHCNRIDPVYQPLMSPEVVAGRTILVLWAPASETKPHRAPGGPGGPFRFWIRLGSETVDAEANGMLEALLDQAARVPWDDRRAFDARIDDLREAGVREYLRDVRSGLQDEPAAAELYRRLRLTARADGHELPRNVALLFFADDPARWFPGARIDVVEFPDGPAGDVLRERIFRGGLADQLRGCLRHLEGLIPTHVRKEPDRFRATRWVDYPLRAVREALVNAVYHRSYQPDAPDPTKVHLYPDRIEITSYPGPGAGHRAPPSDAGSHGAGGACPQPPHRRVPQGARPGRGASDRAGEDLPGDGAERLAAAAVRFRRPADLVPGRAADPPGPSGAGRGRVDEPKGTARLGCAAYRPRIDRGVLAVSLDVLMIYRKQFRHDR